MNNKILNKVLIILGIGIIFVVFAPYLFTRPFGIFNFEDTGSIGDTIGGITAPITSLLGSILVFFALKAQIDANKIIQDQIESQNLEELYRKKVQYMSEQVNIIRNEINDFSYTFTETSRNSNSERKQKFNYTGADAINEFLESLRFIGESHEEDACIEYPKLTELLNLLEIIDSLYDKIEKSTINEEDKQYFKSLLNYQFNSKIKPAFTANEKHRTSNSEPCEKCGKKHYGIPDKIFNLVDKISEKQKK